MSAILNAHTAEPRKLFLLVYTQSRLNISVAAGNESVPIQLAQCRFTGLAISSAKLQMHFSNKIYGSNFIEQHSETVMV